jgi:tetratricopeptide (TPR) repeat protein
MEETTLGLLIDTVKSCSDAGKRYCFILGAGASRASGIKTGAEMAKEWLEELEKNEKESTQEWIEKEKIDKKDIGSHYSKIYGRRFRLDPASGFIRLQNEMEKAIPSPGYYHLAEIIDETQNKLVITTNFDSLTEDSLFIYKDKKALVITHEKLAKYIDALANRPTVIKLHRDILLQPKNDEADVSTLSEEWKSSLQKVFEIYIPIVIGYGGNDGSLMGFLENIAATDRIIYWCYKRGNPVNDQIKNLLEKYHGFLIPIDDFDDTMHLFGEGFDCKFSEETIRQITNKRAEKLVNKYNEWTKNRRKTLDKRETLSDTESMTFNSFRSLSKRNISELEKKIVNGQQSADNYYRLGNEYYFKGEYNKAIEYFTEAVKLKPDNAKYYNDRGISYDWLKEYEKAIVDHSKAIELEPDNAKYYNNRGFGYHELKEYEKAIVDNSEAIELEPDNAEYYNDRGISYSWLKEYEKAIADHSKAIELEPDNAEYYNNRGINYNWLKEYKKSIADHSKAIELKPDNAKYYNNRGTSYNELKEYEKAIADYSKAIELEPDNAKYYNNRGASYSWLNNFEKSIADKSKAIELEPDNAEYYNSRGTIYNWFNDFKKSIADKSKAIELKPDNAKYYNSRGTSYSWLKEYEKAIADHSKAVELEPDNAEYYLSLARVLCRVSNFDSALANLNIAMSLDRELAKCYNVRGFIGLIKAKQDKAECQSDVLNDLNKAIELSKNDVFSFQFYTDRAEYYLYVNEPDKAFDDLQKVFTYGKENGRMLFFMARYFKIKGNNQEYERYMTKAKEYGYIPDDSDY